MSATETRGAMLQISQTELWVIRSAGAAIIAVLGWIGVQFHTALIHVAEIRAELAVVKPADMLAAVHKLEKISMTQSEVVSIVREHGPWPEDRPGWRDWRQSVEQRLISLTSLQRANAEAIRVGTADRWSHSDMVSYARLANAEKKEGETPLPDPQRSTP